MKDHAVAVKHKHRSAKSSSPGPAGEHALALAPPRFGIDFVDRGLPTAGAPIQRWHAPGAEPFRPEESAALARPTQARSVPAPNRTGLPDGLKSGVEALSGMSMDSVNVHYNSSQPASLGALAYAQGADIHVAPGQEQHLPHEAWHVVQQAQGRVKPTMQMRDGVPVNDDEGLEHEADAMGRKALGSPVQRNGGLANDIGVRQLQSGRLHGMDVANRCNTRSRIWGRLVRPLSSANSEGRDWLN